MTALTIIFASICALSIVMHVWVVEKRDRPFSPHSDRRSAISNDRER